MCLIIDANVACLVFNESPDADYIPVSKWLYAPNKDGRIVYGGRLRRELIRTAKVRRNLYVLNQAGRARLVPDNQVDAEESRVAGTGLCRSDDPHIIALARLSGARTLCSCDTALHVDFKNPKLIANPKGSVYQNSGHIALLRHTEACRRNEKSR